VELSGLALDDLKAPLSIFYIRNINRKTKQKRSEFPMQIPPKRKIALTSSKLRKRKHKVLDLQENTN
jgi:hypothetical protein